MNFCKLFQVEPTGQVLLTRGYGLTHDAVLGTPIKDMTIRVQTRIGSMVLDQGVEYEDEQEMIRSFDAFESEEATMFYEAAKLRYRD
jgi:hypothetical protein